MVTGPAAGPEHVALFFGASQGLGAAAARAFARRGAQLCIVARDEVRLRQLREAFRAEGLDLWTKSADVGSQSQVNEAVSDVLNQYGRIDTVIDFAALTGPLDKPIWNLKPEDWRRVMSTNLDGVFHILQAVLPIMNRQGWGKILLASSPFGEMTTPGMGAYATSRAASHALMMQTAAELQASQIGAAVIFPGMTDTEGLAAFRRARGGASLAAPAVSVDVMANLFVWAALQAAQVINGQLLAWSDADVRAAVAELPPI